MSDSPFYWIGVGVSLTIAAAIVIGGLLLIYAHLIHGRFNFILFRKGERRLSIASWCNARLMNDEDFTADDFPICERPFYASYRFGKRRFFLLAGTHNQMSRHAVLRGEHPEHRGKA